MVTLFFAHSMTRLVRLTAIALAVVLILGIIIIDSEQSISGTVQRVETRGGLNGGVVILCLPNNQFIVGRPQALVSWNEMLMHLHQKEPLPLQKAALAWTGRTVTCTGKITKVQGLKAIWIKNDRSNLEIH